IPPPHHFKLLHPVPLPFPTSHFSLFSQRTPWLSFLCFLLGLIAISMLQTMVMASHGHGGPHYDQKRYGPGSLKVNQCPSECTRRCSQTQYHKPCMFFCQKCCRTCLCVPPGYYGNKQVCPCYNNWKTKEGGPKCP
ncbi:gibberellin-regulated protein 4-like, partial [Hibiscus syriacus]|uniref:gibberellin-regulated protein 4-like n=1 Tax=Hibiscus syriacus TaxID=106335 RepID=UPI0019205F66